MSHLVSLLGVKWTWAFAVHMTAFDPKRTSIAPHGLPEKLARAHREQIRLTSLGLFATLAEHQSIQNEPTVITPVSALWTIQAKVAFGA